MKYLAIVLSAIILLTITQAGYTIYFNKFCDQHYQGKRIQFWSQDSLSASWEMDLMGMQTRTINILLERNRMEMEEAFESNGNIGNPKLNQLLPHFINALDETTLFFQHPESIEKLEIVVPQC